MAQPVFFQTEKPAIANRLIDNFKAMVHNTGIPQGDGKKSNLFNWG